MVAEQERVEHEEGPDGSTIASAKALMVALIAPWQASLPQECDFLHWVRLCAVLEVRTHVRRYHLHTTCLSLLR